MVLEINKDVFITCAVTGSGSSQDKSSEVPRSPKEIAESAVDAAKAGAAVVHCHVRDPDSGVPSRRVDLYKEVTQRIRDSGTDVILNLTTGMGGDIYLGKNPEKPLPLKEPETDLIGASERIEHLISCKPEICTLDCGTMNFAEDNYVMTNTPGMLASMAKKISDLGILPEIEVFDTGHLWLAKKLIQDGLIKDPVLLQLCMGIPWGAPNDINTFLSLINNVPKGWTWSAFSIGRFQMPYVAMAVLGGGNVRVGLEDNIWLEKGRLAKNYELVEKAVNIIESLGSKVMSPDEVRNKLHLKKA